MASELERKAYIIGGHGLEGSETFIVPPGCTIVVKAYSGAPIKAYSTLKQGLCSFSPTILKNPIEHYTELFDTFGSLAIYQSGDICPNFYYELLTCYKRQNSCSSFGSGLLDVDRIYEDSTHINHIRLISSHTRELQNRNVYQNVLETSSDNSLIYKYLMNLYRYSVVPTPESIGNLIDDLHDAGNETLPAIIAGLKKEVTYTQRELCSRFPGIYYNFVCRVPSSGIVLYKKINNSYELPSQFSFSKNTYQEELQRAEAELENTVSDYFTKNQANPNDPLLPTMDTKIKNTQSYIEQLRAHPNSISQVLRGHIGNSLYRKPYIKSMYEKRYAVKKGPSRATLRRRVQRRRQKNKTRKNTNK